MPKSQDTTVSRDNLAYLTVELDNTHPTPVSWGSQDMSTGYARVLIDLNTMTIHQMEMVVDGMFASGDPETTNMLQQNTSTVQPFHFHNLPQGGPKFFVQQLFDYDSEAGEISTATLENTETGFRFAIDESYALRAPVNDPARAEFVTPELIAGTGYLGLHTEALPVPATALAGQINVFGLGTLDGKLQWLGDTDDAGIGSRKNDLLSLGAGDDFANGKRGDDVIDGGAGDDFILGKAGDDTAWGGDGNDVLRGGKGEDVLFGNRGDDRLNGGRGEDNLNGGFGDDTLKGGNGDDMLTGGEGADVFIFARRSGSDTITDFTLGEDDLKFKGGQFVVEAQLLDLDGGGVADDTQLILANGQIDILNTDLTDWFC